MPLGGQTSAAFKNVKRHVFYCIKRSIYLTINCLRLTVQGSKYVSKIGRVYNSNHCRHQTTRMFNSCQTFHPFKSLTDLHIWYWSWYWPLRGYTNIIRTLKKLATCNYSPMITENVNHVIFWLTQFDTKMKNLIICLLKHKIKIFNRK